MYAIKDGKGFIGVQHEGLPINFYQFQTFVVEITEKAIVLHAHAVFRVVGLIFYC